MVQELFNKKLIFYVISRLKISMDAFVFSSINVQDYYPRDFLALNYF